MFFFLPIGHDRSVYGYPWVTFGIVAACCVLFLSSCVQEISAGSDIAAAEARVRSVLERHPHACVDWRLEGLPDQVLETFQPPVCPSVRKLASAGDAELDLAMRELVREINGIWSLRLIYRPGRPDVGAFIGNIFMHGGLSHLFGNMVFLLLAGSLVETTFRRWPFFGLFMLSGFGGTLVHHFSDAESLVGLVGASGAISGLMAAVLVHHPTVRIKIGYLIVFPVLARGVVPVAAWACIPAWVLFQVLHVALGANDGVAYWAHIGGFAVGLGIALVVRASGLHEVDFAEYEVAQKKEAVRQMLDRERVRREGEVGVDTREGPPSDVDHHSFAAPERAPESIPLFEEPEPREPCTEDSESARRSSKEPVDPTGGELPLP